MAGLDSQKSASNLSTLNNEEGENHGPDIEKQPTKDETYETREAAKRYPETDLSQGVIGWDSQEDPQNPQNFPAGKKWALLGLISAFTFISPLASSMFSPALVYMAAEFHETNETILSFTVSIFLVGYTVS